jgi:hypothetical protein
VAHFKHPVLPDPLEIHCLKPACRDSRQWVDTGGRLPPAEASADYPSAWLCSGSAASVFRHERDDFDAEEMFT